MDLHGFLNVDKPLGWTSHDVVGRLRRIVGTKRVGHAGTLDPAATGVLVIGVGRGTRFLDYVQSRSKAYLAHVVLGAESDTADLDGRLEPPGAELIAGHQPERTDVENAARTFTGTIEQIPPKYSAIKQDGEPLHRRMRRGEPVDVPVRQVEIESIDVLFYRYPDLVLDVSCGSGVYIRSLARDIGEKLGTTAYLHHLIRTRVGRFTLAESHALDALAQLRFPQSWTSVAASIDSGIAESPTIYLDWNRTDAWYHGRSIRAISEERASPDTVRAFSLDGTFAGIGSIRESDSQQIEIRPRVVLAPS